MKKLLSMTLCVGILLGASSAITAHADGTTTGTTTVNSEVTKGDLTLKVDGSTDFGQKPLSSVVDFGTRDINYTVTNYTGETNGFTISAKLSDKDDKRSVKIGEVELSQTAAAVVTKSTDAVGENTDKVSASLKYTGVEKAQKCTFNIEWTLTNGTSAQIAE